MRRLEVVKDDALAGVLGLRGEEYLISSGLRGRAGKCSRGAGLSRALRADESEGRRLTPSTFIDFPRLL